MGSLVVGFLFAVLFFLIIFMCGRMRFLWLVFAFRFYV
jgi:hypothetical protein